MSDNIPNSEGQSQEPASQNQNPDPNANPNGGDSQELNPNGEQQPAGTDEENEDNLPEWARKALTKANNQAAEARVRANQIMEQYKDAKTVEEFQQMQAELSANNEKLELDLARERVGRQHRLPDELVEVLQGKTPEELEAHALKLAKFSGVKSPTPPPPPPPPTGDRDGRQGDPDDESPEALAKKAMKLR